MSFQYHDPKFEYEEIFADTGWPWSGHKNFAYDFVRNFKPEVIVELGTHKGTSLWSFAQAVKDGEINSEISAVDTWQGEKHAGFYGEEVFEGVKKIQQKYYPDLKINLVRKTFDKALTDFADQSIDLLHIDGLHTYEAVKHDFESWLPKVKKDGVIMFHDVFVSENDFGVYKFWEELKKKYKSVEFHHSFGLGVILLDNKKYENLLKGESEMQRKYAFLSEDGKNYQLNIELDALHLKNKEIANLDKNLKEVIHLKNKEIANLDKNLKDKNKEIRRMKLSIFWRIRDKFLKIKNIFVKQENFNQSRKILFISHDASKSGAPIVLLYFLRWLKANTNIKFSILLQDGGEIKNEFEDIAPTYCMKDMHLINKQNSIYPRPIYYLIKYLGLRKVVGKNYLIKLLLKQNFDLIFANSVASCKTILEIKKFLDLPVINYIHELANTINYFCDKTMFTRVSKLVDLYIGSSQSVVENLRNNHKIAKDKIALVHDYIPTSEFLKNQNFCSRDSLERDLDIPKNAFVVGASGTLEWRKGLDLYPQIAYLVKQKSDLPIVFLWIGGTDNAEFERVLQDIKKMKLKNKIFFVEYKVDYFYLIDVFLLSSREDPYPLVCLQAALFKKPIICFDLAGGMPEFVGQDCGFVIPYLDVEKVAEKIIFLAQNKNIVQKLGGNAAKKVLERHDVEKASRELLKIIKKVSL